MRRHGFSVGLRGLAAVALLAAAAAFRPASAEVTLLTIDPRATLSADRTQVTVTGAFQCTAGESVNFFGAAVQIKGREVVQAGEGSGSINCTGAVQSWTLTFSTTPGTKWSPGPATVLVQAFPTEGSAVQLQTRVLFHD